MTNERVKKNLRVIVRVSQKVAKKMIDTKKRLLRSLILARPKKRHAGTAKRGSGKRTKTTVVENSASWIFSQMAFRARKVIGTFEKRAPGLSFSNDG